METISISPSVSMPVLGLGVYKTADPHSMSVAVDSALSCGYRSFDTAQMYENERLLGQALAGQGLPRPELFLTTKIAPGHMGYQAALDAARGSLEALQTDYLDLLLIHWPGQQRPRLLETWHALEELRELGLVRAIGVCNAVPRHLQWLLDDGGTPPAVNQVERHPLQIQRELMEWCAPRGIHLEAWAPLIRGNLDLPLLHELSRRYGKTPAQIILRWDIQSGWIVIPKSVHPDRIAENAGLFDFVLTPEDMSRLDALHTGARTSRDPETYDF